MFINAYLIIGGFKWIFKLVLNLILEIDERSHSVYPLFLLNERDYSQGYVSSRLKSYCSQCSYICLTELLILVESELHNNHSIQ